jgi:hypothetical protein
MIHPGMVVICGDSHTTTYGALGALGFGIGTSEVEQVLATQTLVYRLAGNMRIRVDGQLPAGTTSKDLILMIIGTIGAQGARGYVVEYCGSAIDAMSVEARFTLCNMTVEAGARGALIAPDQTALDYVLSKCPDIQGPVQQQALAQWKQLHSDADAKFDVEHVFNANQLEPRSSGGNLWRGALTPGCCRRQKAQRRASVALCPIDVRRQDCRHAHSTRLHWIMYQWTHRRPAGCRPDCGHAQSGPRCARHGGSRLRRGQAAG